MHLGHVHDGVQLPGRVPGGLQAVLVPRGADTHRPGLQVEAVGAAGGAGVGQHQGHILLWLGLTTLMLPCWGRGEAGTLNAVTAFITDSVVVVMAGVLVLTLRRGGEGEGEVGGVSAREDLLMRLVGGFTRVTGRILAAGLAVTTTTAGMIVTFPVSETVSETAENPGQTFAAGAAVAISGCVLLRS